VILFFTQFPIKFLASFVSNFNTVPLLPEFFKVVGMAVFARTILFKAPRERFFATLRGILAAIFKDRSSPKPAPQSTAIVTADAQSTSFQKFCMAVDEDFNFAGGLAVLFELAKSLGKQANNLNHGAELTVESGVLFQQWQELSVLANVLGLEAKVSESIEQSPDQSDAEIDALVAQRNKARQDKNFAEADRIRKELEAKGIELIDKKGTTTWRYH
jgi:cysteinyl-tRNA synthetase